MKPKAAKNQAGNVPDREVDSLYGAILSVKDLREARRFFRDLLTADEIDEFSRRWQAVRMLDAEISYVEIQKVTGLSSTTVARISDWLNNGMGGYGIILDRMHQVHHHFPPVRKKH